MYLVTNLPMNVLFGLRSRSLIKSIESVGVDLNVAGVCEKHVWEHSI